MVAKLAAESLHRGVAHELGYVQVYDLGADGKDLKRVAEVANFAQAAERAAGGRDIFGGRSSADRKVSSLTSFHPPTEWPAMLKASPHCLHKDTSAMLTCPAITIAKCCTGCHHQGSQE